MKSQHDLLREFIRIHDNLDLTLLDVGAANHESGLPEDLQAIINFIGVDPDVLSWPSPAQRHYKSERWFEAIVSDEIGESEFYVTRKREVSSLKKPNDEVIGSFFDPARFQIINTTRHLVTTINQMCLEHEIEKVDYLKIDTQGNALETLRGASNILPGVQTLMVELEVLELYERQALFEDSVSFLRGLGFSIVDMRPIYWKRGGNEFDLQDKGQLAFFNVLFFNDKKIVDFSEKRSLVARVFFLLLYGYMDIAYELVVNSPFVNEDRFVKTRHLLQSFINYDKFSPFEGSIAEWKPL